MKKTKLNYFGLILGLVSPLLGIVIGEFWVLFFWLGFFLYSCVEEVQENAG